MKPDRRKLWLPKRLLFQFVVLISVYGLMEIASLAFLNQTYTEIIERRRLISTRDPISGGGSQFDFPMMLHPYLGIVYQPRQQDLQQQGDQLRITEYGFLDHQSPLRKRASDRVVIAITGGSVARQLTNNASEVLERELSKIPLFQGKRFEFVRLAIDGNKQPQQLMTLNYLLMLGGEFDLIINLDGVNEIALPVMDNAKSGVAPAFPRKWGMVTAAAVSRDLMRLLGYEISLITAQRDQALWMDQSLIRYSPTGCWIWQVRNARLETLRQEFHQRKLRIMATESTICSSGPRQEFETEEQLLNYCAEIWARSSKLMNDLCQANQIHYFHFLQPNQYVPDSKPMSEFEFQGALNKESPFMDPVRTGYPVMREMAPRLRAAGVEFTDLTQVFADHPERVYVDDCCHVNQEGDRIMAEAIAAQIALYFRNQPEARPPTDR